MKNKYFTLLFLLITLCSYSQLAIEGFETGWGLSASGTNSTGWFTMQNNVGLTITWVQGDANSTIQQPAYAGERAAFLAKNNVSIGLPEDYLITPQFQVPQDPELHFFSRLTSPGDQGSIYKVFILNLTANPAADLNAPASYTELQSWTELQINPEQTEYLEKVITIPDTYIGANVRIAFMMSGNNGDRWLIDDVSVIKKCLNAVNLTASDITLTTADLLWENPGEATQWEIELIASTAASTGNGVAVSTMPFTYTNLTVDSCYKYYVRAVCDGVNKSNWAGPYFFCTQRLGDTCEHPIVVNQLPFSELNNTFDFSDYYEGLPGTGCNNNALAYLSGNDVVYSYTATFSGLVSIDLSNNEIGSGVFIYDSCANIGVSCISGGIATNASPQVSITDFAVVNGQTYYIVVSSSADVQTTQYNLTIQPQPCARPENLQATNLGMNAATLSWANPGGSASWEVQVQASGTGLPNSAGEYTTSTNTGFDVPSADLTASTNYEYYVRANCGNGTFSAWAGPYLFSTAACAVSDQCTYTFIMTSDVIMGYWLDSSIKVSQNGVELATLTGPVPGIYETVVQTIKVCKDIPLDIFFNSGGTSDFVALTVKNSYQQEVYVKELGVGSPGTLLYSDNVNCDTPICTPPINLATANEGQNTVDLSWDGNATGTWQYYITEAGQPAPLPTTVGTLTTVDPVINAGGEGVLEPATSYEYYVRLVCDEQTNTVSDWSEPHLFSTTLCEPTDKCNYTFVITDQYSLGGLETSFTISQNGVPVTEIGSTFFNGASETYTVPLCPDSPFEITWSEGGIYPPFIGLTVTSPFNQLLYNLDYESDSLVGTLLYTGTVDCENPGCVVPRQLTATNILSTTVDLGWDGPSTGTWQYYIVDESGDTPTADTAGIITTTNPTIGATIEPSKNYKFYVRYLCASGEYTEWSDSFAFKSPACDNECKFLFELTTIEGYGWSSNTLTITQAGINVAEIGDFIAYPGVSKTYEVSLCPDLPFDVFWNYAGSLNTPGYGDRGLNIFTPSMEEVYHMEPGTESPGTIIFSGKAECEPTCLKPKNLTATAISMDSVTLGWNEMGTAIQWEVFIVPTGGDMPADDAVGILAGSNPFVLTQGIEPGKVYDYYVRAICSTDDKSFWSRPYSFQTAMCTTSCDYTFTMSSTMPEEGAEGWTPASMKILQNGLVVGIITQPLFSDGNANSVETIPLCSGIPFTIHWYDPSEPWDYAGADYSDYVGLTVVNNSTGATVFQMAAESGSAEPNTDIFTAVPSCEAITCPQPTNILVTNATATSKTLSWTAGGSETQWEVIVQNADGSFPIGNVVITATVNTLSYTAENLDNGVFYEYYVRAVCSTSDKSFWSASQPFNAYTPPGSIVEIRDANDPDAGVIADGTEFTLCPEDTCMKFSAAYLAQGDTTVYEVESIPYLPPYPYTGGTPIDFTIENGDGQFYFSPVINIPFDFCFFGQTYSGVTVSPEGAVTFDVIRSGEMTPWFINDPIPNANFPIKNAIYGVFQSLTLATTNEFANPNINYQIQGTAPNRALVINFYEVAGSVLSCDSDPSIGSQTSQMIMYEGSNIIEVHIGRRVSCADSYLNKGVVGIQNADGTAAVAPEGRNTGHWTTFEESWRFVPAGPTNTTFEWLKNDIVVGTETDIEVCATTETILKARATYISCNGEAVIKESNVKLSLYDPIITNEPKDLTLCPNGVVTFDLNQSLVGIVENPADYTFSFYATEEAATGGGTNTLNPSYLTDTAQTIYVRIKENDKPCFIVKSFELLFNNIAPQFTLTEDKTICFGSDAILSVTPVDFNLTDATYVWTKDGGQLSQTTPVITVTEEGEYGVMVTKNGCTDTKTVTVIVLPLPDIEEVEDIIACNTYELPPLTKGAYYTGSGGKGEQLAAGNVINTTQDIFVYAQSDTEPKCTNEKKFTVTVVSIPQFKISEGCDGTDYILEAVFTNDVYNQDNAIFEWLNTEDLILGTEYRLVITKIGTYTLQVSAKDHSDCLAEVSIDVIETNCDIPRGISPNNDGKNDEFDLSGLDVKKISIFNRYGEEVYSKSNYTKEWHGQSGSNHDLPTGTYFYMIERTSGESNTGWVYINRESN